MVWSCPSHLIFENAYLAHLFPDFAFLTESEHSSSKDLWHTGEKVCVYIYNMFASD